MDWEVERKSGWAGNERGDAVRFVVEFVFGTIFDYTFPRSDGDWMPSHPSCGIQSPHLHTVPCHHR